MHVSSFLADILFLFKKIYIGKPANGVTDLKLFFFFFSLSSFSFLLMTGVKRLCT